MKDQLKAFILSSPFFQVPGKLTKKQLADYCDYWLPLQDPFSLGIITLTGKIAQKISDLRYQQALSVTPMDSHANKINQLEEILLSQAPAAIDELGIGRVPSVMHHKLFRNQIANAGITTTKFFQGRMPEPLDALIFNIRAALALDINEGLAMMEVVETIAPELFRAQYEIFLRAGIDDSVLEHSRIHCSLEKEHAGDAAFMGNRIRGLFSHDRVDVSVERYAKVWKTYLDWLAEKIYN